MSQANVQPMTQTTTLPIPPHDAAVIALALGLLALTALVYAAASVMQRDRPPPTWESLSPGWLALLVPLALLWIALLLLTLAAALAGTYRMIATPGAASLGTGTLIVALLGAPFLVWSTLIRFQTQRTQHEGHMTDRIAKAVEQLGAEKTSSRIGRPVTLSHPVSLSHDDDRTETVIEWQGTPLALPPGSRITETGDWQAFTETRPNIEVRLGALLALERIARDSTARDKGRDHVPVMEILCAYIRENARAENLTPSEPPFKRATPRIDIQTALNVIKRRSDEQIRLEAEARYRLDLRDTNLDGCDLRKGKFAGARFWRSRLESADLFGSDLTGAQFQRCLLNFAEFGKAQLRGTNLDHCISNLPKPAVFNAGILGGDVHGVSVAGADLSSLAYLGKDAKAIFGSKDTMLVGDLMSARYELRELETNLRVAESNDDAAEIARLEKEIDDNPVSHWCEFDSNDLEYEHFRHEFLESLSLTGFPFDD